MIVLRGTWIEKINKYIYWLLAQSVERAAVNRKVVGSSPTLPASSVKSPYRYYQDGHF